MSEAIDAIRDERNHWIGEAKKFERCWKYAEESNRDWIKRRNEEHERAERAEAAEHDARADYDRRGERLWRLAAAAGWRPGNDADNDATAETHILERLRDAERAEAELAALRERVTDRAWAFDAMGKHAHAEGLRDLQDDDTTGAASGEGRLWIEVVANQAAEGQAGSYETFRCNCCANETEGETK